MIRALLAAIVVASACSHHAATPGPAARDVDPAVEPLAFLPADSELVVEIRFHVLESSRTWSWVGPKLTSALRAAMSSPAWSDCVWGNLEPLDRITVAMKGARTIAVLRSAATSEMFACLQQRLAADGAKVVTDRGVVVAYFGRAAVAFALAGPHAIVFDVDRAAGHDSLAALVASGAPLRRVRGFADKHRAISSDTAVWLLSNGDSDLLRALNARAADAALFLTDQLYGDVTVEVASADDAKQLVAMLGGQLAPWRSIVDNLDIAAQGSVVRVHVVASRLDVLLTLLAP